MLTFRAMPLQITVLVTWRLPPPPPAAGRFMNKLSLVRTAKPGKLDRRDLHRCLQDDFRMLFSSWISQRISVMYVWSDYLWGTILPDCQITDGKDYADA